MLSARNVQEELWRWRSMNKRAVHLAQTLYAPGREVARAIVDSAVAALEAQGVKRARIDGRWLKGDWGLGVAALRSAGEARGVRILDEAGRIAMAREEARFLVGD